MTVKGDYNKEGFAHNVVVAVGKEYPGWMIAGFIKDDGNEGTDTSRV